MNTLQNSFSTSQRSDNGETLYTLAYEKGLTITVSSRGANLRSVQWKGRELTLAYGDFLLYGTNPSYLGATVGRFANRIADSRALIQGNYLALARNNGKNHLHGGPSGFHLRFWSPELLKATLRFKGQDYEAQGIRLLLKSPAYDEGFPGNLSLETSFFISESGLLFIHYKALSDAETLCNITNHCYWNLDGEGKGIHSLRLKAHCKAWLPAFEGIPEGTFEAVKGSQYDFSEARALGDILDPLPESVLENGGKGVDHCFVIDPESEKSPAVIIAEKNGELGAASEKTLRKAASLEGKDLAMEVWTNKPGIQIYTQNSGDGTPLRTGRLLSYRGVCLETQFLPDCPNKAELYRAQGRDLGYSDEELKNWDSRLAAGATYEAYTVHQFYSL